MYQKEDPDSIQELFNNIAPSYQKTNRLLSLGIDNTWRKKLIKALPSNCHSLVDLCTGTGDLSQMILSKNPHMKITGLDFSEQMLQIARENIGQNVTFVQGDVLQMPFSDKSFDLATLAFSLRNFENLEVFFQEVNRVLQDGGHFYFVELTKPNNIFLRSLYYFHLNVILPLIGGLSSGNYKAYRYLSNSIKKFYEYDELKKLIKSTGFKNVELKPLTGGIATLISGQKI